eukprot:5344546-Amphidinium_carterae.1
MYGTQDASQIWQKNYTKLLGPQIVIEHNVRHIEHFGLGGAKVKALDCPSVKVGMQEIQRRTTRLEPAETTKDRSGVMSLL